MVTIKEKQVLDAGLKKGSLTHSDFRVIFSPNYVQGIINKFLVSGFIETGNGDKFKINKTKIQEALNEN